MITITEIKRILPSADYAVLLKYAQWLPALEKHDINTPARIGAFISQIGHESANFKYTKEIASGAEYDTGKKAIALGNTPGDDNDGEKLKGRGLLQVTGTNNYRACSRYLFGDDRLLENPELLEQPRWALESACWYWNSRNINLICDKPEDWHKPGVHNYDKFQWITILINGGLNGYNERLANYNRARKVLNF